MFVMHSRLFIAALWSPAGKELTSWLLFVMFNCDFVTLPYDILGQVWYLIISIPDLCRLSNFNVPVTNNSVMSSGTLPIDKDREKAAARKG